MNRADVNPYSTSEVCLIYTGYFYLNVPKHCVLLNAPLVNSTLCWALCWALCWLLGIVQHSVNQALFAGWSQQRNVRLSFNISTANISRLHLEFQVRHLYLNRCYCYQTVLYEAEEQVRINRKALPQYLDSLSYFNKQYTHRICLLTVPQSLNPLPLLHSTVPSEPLLCKFADGGQKKRQSMGRYLQHGRPWTRDGETVSSHWDSKQPAMVPVASHFIKAVQVIFYSIKYNNVKAKMSVLF